MGVKITQNEWKMAQNEWKMAQNEVKRGRRVLVRKCFFSYTTYESYLNMFSQ